MGFTEYLQERSGVAKQWFVEKGISKTDFLKQVKEDLLVKIASGTP